METRESSRMTVYENDQYNTTLLRFLKGLPSFAVMGNGVFGFNPNMVSITHFAWKCNGWLKGPDEFIKITRFTILTNSNYFIKKCY